MEKIYGYCDRCEENNEIKNAKFEVFTPIGESDKNELAISGDCEICRENIFMTFKLKHGENPQTLMEATVIKQRDEQAVKEARELWRKQEQARDKIVNFIGWIVGIIICFVIIVVIIAVLKWAFGMVF
jgi:RNA polymerase-binding transcription factor DksA